MGRKRSFLRKAGVFLVFITVFVTVVAAAVPRMGTWLVHDQELEQADALVVLMGSTADRVLEAYDLYAQGFAPVIIMVRSRQIGGQHALEQGLRIPGNADISAEALNNLGVPEQGIVILPGEAASTRDEAVSVLKYLQDRPDLSSLILVTSSFHSRRAGMVFKNVLEGTGAMIQIAPSRYTDFQAETWYQDRDSAKWTVLEYLKFAGWMFD